MTTAMGMMRRPKAMLNDEVNALARGPFAFALGKFAKPLEHINLTSPGPVLSELLTNNQHGCCA